MTIEAAEVVAKKSQQDMAHLDGDLIEYITVFVGEQLFGIPVTVVQDVFEVQRMTAVPMSVPEVRGVLNTAGNLLPARMQVGRAALDVARRQAQPSTTAG